MSPDNTPFFTTGLIRPLDCVREAWELIKSDYWLLFAISLIGAMIAGATMYILFGAMICGIFICYLKKIDGGEVKFEDLWLGMKYLGKSVPVTLAFVIPLVLYITFIFITMYGPLITAAIMGERADPTIVLGSFAVFIAIDLVIAVAMTIIHSLIMFAFPLIVDKGLNGIDAMKLSARAAMKNAKGIGGLILVNFGMVIAGQLAFCVGVYLVIPLLTATSLVAYRKVFPRTDGLVPQI